VEFAVLLAATTPNDALGVSGKSGKNRTSKSVG